MPNPPRLLTWKGETLTLVQWAERLKSSPQAIHSTATEVQRRYEDDAATAAAIGDTPEVARQVYADSPGEAVARRIAKETG